MVAPLSFTPRTRPLFVVMLIVLAATLAGCSRPAQESTSGTSGPVDTRAPNVTVVENHEWTLAASGGGAVKIIVVNVTASAATTMRWQDVHLHLPGWNFTASSAYVRLPNGTSFGWNASRTLAANETMTVEIHFRTAGTIEEPTTGSIDGPGWTARFDLAPPSPHS